MSRRGSVLEGVDFKPMTFEGQERGAEMLLQSRQLDQQKENQKALRERKAADDLAAKQKWIDDNYDPNKDLSGNPLADPTYNKGMAEINMKAYKLAADGADINTIKMMLSPDADKLHNYSIKAKAINDNLDKQLQGVPIGGGYKKDVLKKRALESAMLDEQGGIRNDIDETGDYLGKVISEKPLEVTDASGLENFVKETMTNAKPQVVETKTYNSRGGYDKRKLKITAPDWMILDKDERGNNTRQLVPKYEIATDDGNPIEHTFIGKDGKETKAAVRLVDDQLFNYVLKSNPSYSDNLRGQVMEVIKSGEYKDDDGNPIALNSPQAKNVAKALMYNDLKLLSKGGVEDIVEEKPTQIKISNSSGSGSGDNTQIRDVFNEMNKKYESGIKQFGTDYRIPLNELSATAQGVAIKYANELTKADPPYGQADIYVDKDAKGNFNIREASTGNLIAPMDFTDVNIKVQPGVAEKREVVEQGKNKTETQAKPEIVEQNGHRYKLNKKTGQYEPIK